jgi:hypothetical protein
VVNQYYIHCVDEDFGAFFIKFSSYFPYGGKLLINGHHYAQAQAARAGIGFTALDNGFAAVDDVAAVQAICDRPAGLAAHGPGGPAAADDIAVPPQDRLRHDQQPQPPAPRFRYHTEQGREQCPVRPVQLQAVRLLPLHYGELVAQDQDLRGLPCLLTPGQPQPRNHPRDQEEGEPQAHDQ